MGVIGASPLLNTWLAYLNGRKRLSFTPYGDQSIFMTRDTFRCVGGVPPIPIMEDLESFLSSGLTSPCLAETLKRYLIESEEEQAADPPSRLHPHRLTKAERCCCGSTSLLSSFVADRW